MISNLLYRKDGCHGRIMTAIDRKCRKARTIGGREKLHGDVREMIHGCGNTSEQTTSLKRAKLTQEFGDSVRYWNEHISMDRFNELRKCMKQASHSIGAAIMDL
jgi:hypothetical protein